MLLGLNIEPSAAHLSFMYYRCTNTAINKKQISPSQRQVDLLFQRLGAAAFENRGNDSAHSRCVTTGPIMLLIKYPTSQ